MVRKNKNEYKKSLIEKMHISSKTDTKKYWKLLENFNPQAKSNINNISSEDWVNYFESLFCDKGSNEIPHTTDKGPLDFEITEKELMDASSLLNPGKSPGLDSILNEMISCTLILILTYFYLYLIIF